MSKLKWQKRLMKWGASDKTLVLGLSMKFIDSDKTLVTLLLTCKSFNEHLKDAAYKQSLLYSRSYMSK